MQRDIATKTAKTTPGVLASLAEGFSVAVFRPVLIVVPLLLDLYYWLGWKVAPTALATSLTSRIGSADGIAVDHIRRSLSDFGHWNVADLASFFVPSMLSGVDRSSVYTVRDRSAVAPDRWWIDALAIAGVFVLSALLLAAYSVPLADAVLERRRTVRETVAAVRRAWVGLLGLFAALVGIAALVFAPLAVAWVALLAVDVDAGQVLAAVAVLAGFAIYLAIWFAPDAVVVSQATPLQAIALSALVVRRHFFETVGFVAATIVIDFGLTSLWLRMSQDPPGLLLGVIANAVVATGLATASLYFFNSRIRALRPDAAFPPPSGGTPRS